MANLHDFTLKKNATQVLLLYLSQLKNKYFFSILALILLKKIITMRQDIDQEEWIELTEKDNNGIILDVRTPDEISDGYIANMKAIDFLEGQEFLEEIAKLDKSKNYYIYCRSGNRSGQACDIMEQLGFENTYNLEGGFMNWTGDIQE